MGTSVIEIIPNRVQDLSYRAEPRRQVSLAALNAPKGGQISFELGQPTFDTSLKRERVLKPGDLLKKEGYLNVVASLFVEGCEAEGSSRNSLTRFLGFVSRSS